ncbi:MAG: sn-glycerol-1-phosphate dehydrogenase [Bacteroidales bacterium]|jgi:glycerol-1-phosphate dehydrogenase [NAD(P)+]|nr:sn-glycerol-1-phosphate dehydrogenase [Bacteroidales bacterium]MCI1784807.1 sn-glycerol-1-phosphate dehydrogenase [Bacteroidales bacterium]
MDTKERVAKAVKIATDTKAFVLQRACLDMAPKIFTQFFNGRKAVVIADENTWKAAGEKVFGYMVSAGIPTDRYIIKEKEFHAEWRYVDMVNKVLDGDMDAASNVETDTDYSESDPEKAMRPVSEDYPVAVAVGSGVINDLCKLCSYYHGQSYMTVPTAASVDGFSSFGASISYENAKQTFNCPAPVAILADVDVLIAAPKEMTAAGYADLAAKIPAGAEWMIADLMGTEPIIPEAWHVLQDVLDGFLSNPGGVAAGDPDAVSDLFEGLTLSGFAMQAARSSRPASCCDHLFSHILDMTGHKYHGKLQSHGFQVAIGTLTMCAVFDEFLKYDLCKTDVEACVKAWPTLEQEQERALSLFKDFPAPKLGYESITKKYTDADAVRKELTLVGNNWPDFRKQLQDQVYPFSKMQDFFKIAGAPYDPSMIGITRRQLRDMFPFVQLMRWRFNVLDLAKRLGIYDELVASVFAEGGAWDLNKESKIQ